MPWKQLLFVIEFTPLSSCSSIQHHPRDFLVESHYRFVRMKIPTSSDQLLGIYIRSERSKLFLNKLSTDEQARQDYVNAANYTVACDILSNHRSRVLCFENSFPDDVPVAKMIIRSSA